jgi:hypothetical protein
LSEENSLSAITQETRAIFQHRVRDGRRLWSSSELRTELAKVAGSVMASKDVHELFLANPSLASLSVADIGRVKTVGEAVRRAIVEHILNESQNFLKNEAAFRFEGHLRTEILELIDQTLSVAKHGSMAEQKTMIHELLGDDHWKLMNGEIVASIETFIDKLRRIHFCLEVVVDPAHRPQGEIYKRIVSIIARIIAVVDFYDHDKEWFTKMLINDCLAAQSRGEPPKSLLP